MYIYSYIHKFKITNHLYTYRIAYTDMNICWETCTLSNTVYVAFCRKFLGSYKMKLFLKIKF